MICGHLDLAAGEQLLDTDGVVLCLRASGWRSGICRWGTECQYSHGTPDTLSQQRINVEKLRLTRKTKSISPELQAKLLAAKAANALPVPDWVHAARTQLTFDIAHPIFLKLQTFACSFLGAEVDNNSNNSLANLHLQPLNSASVPLCPALLFAHKHGGHKLPTKWKRALMDNKSLISRFTKSPHYKSFILAYKELVEQIVAPLCCGDETGIVYQCPPTLRVQMPSHAPTIGMHKDSDFAAHESSEINFWIPLTSVWGDNTLQLESSPNKSDFHPMELQPGEGLRFDGANCRHFTNANTTNSTRVSFDFRVIPRSLFRNDFDNMIGDYPVAFFPST
ncbi:hypothetical protein ScalyP_jg665 [Parmales sp. scaly parma]|nr:hypothetical protein ScalyP_jg665 [Parmales sp. scaly parma]